jgi:hypothetical protein
MTSFPCFASTVLEIDFMAYQNQSCASEFSPVSLGQMHVWMANIGGYKLDQSLFVLGVGLDTASFVG